jgi:type II secretory pathway pseudopilin PulG
MNPLPRNDESPPAIATPRKKGFSLIETAVILAVLGLVIGGIWVAAAAVNETIKVNRSVEFVLTVATNLQTKWKGATFSALELSSNYPITSCVADGGLIPSDFDWPGGYPDCTAGYTPAGQHSRMRDPWGNTIGVGVNTDLGVDVYKVTFYNISKAPCKKIVAAVSNRVGNSGDTIYYISNGTVPLTKTAAEFPVSLDSLCPNATNGYLIFGIPIR